MYNQNYLIPIRAFAEVMSREVLSVANQENNWYVGLTPSISRMPVSHKFNNLVSTWKKETLLAPSPREMISNHAYLSIIGMGKEATPYILHEMNKNPDYWFVALRSITGVDPVKTEDRGDMIAMSHSWLKWGRDNGYNY